MEIFLLIIVILISVGFNIYMFIRQTERGKKPKKVENKPKLTREEKEKQEQIKKSFENLMNYDEKIARRRK